jgi:predicted N-formylglutamate amidohydrolase
MDMPPVEIVAGRDASLLFLCDHARNRVPPGTGEPAGSLGLPEAEMARHIAYDVGARGVALALAAAFDAPAILTTISRLVIDPNRAEDDPTLVMRIYDGTIIPANRAVDEAEIERRREAFHRPYHRAIVAALDGAQARGIVPLVVSIHSMTERLRGRPPRPWQIAVLYASDDRIARPLIARLRAEGLVVGDNEPYRGALAGDTMDRHCIARGLPHALIEVRNDLISGEAGERAWAARLAGPLAEVIEAARRR